MTAIDIICGKIRRSPKGSIFFINSFPDIDEKYTANVLSALSEKKTLVRLAPGIYTKPVQTKFGPLLPTDYEIVQAVAKRDKAKILPAGETVLNMLHFSTQVPMNMEFLTSGTPRVIKLGNRTIKLKRSAPKNFACRGELMPLLILAFRAIGKDYVTEEHLGIARKWLLEKPEPDTWRDDINIAPVWIKKMILKLKQSIGDE